MSLGRKLCEGFGVALVGVSLPRVRLRLIEVVQSLKMDALG